MRCNEALGYWQRELMGQAVDPAKLEEAFAHIGACQDLCARTLSASPDYELLSSPAQRAGQTDLYEALGLSAEEDGDAHARAWARLKRLVATGKASQEALDYERAMALAAWQAAANYYDDGLRIGETLFLREGLKRIKKKRLEPTTPHAERSKTDPRRLAARVASRKTSARLTSTDAPAAVQDSPAHETGPLLALVAHGPRRLITVGQSPPGWQINTVRAGAPPVLRETSVAYSISGSRTSSGLAKLSQPQVGGRLAALKLALWASAFSRTWELDVLVRAHSSQRPWTSITLTLEGSDQRPRQPTPMEFAQRAPQMVGWWARLKEIEAGEYHLRFSANDSRGKPAQDAMLG
ncbi:MAG TPA: hypothetical protein VH590_04385, partial [Ktedonobacterales bacterium]